VKRFGTTVTTHLPAAADAASTGLGRWHLYVVHSPDANLIGEAFPLLSRVTHVGRSPESGPHLRIAVADERMSRRHASVVNEGRNPVISDCGSSNGLYVDSRRVESAVLDAGTVVRFGDTLMVAGRGELCAREEATDFAMVGRSPAVGTVRALIRKVGPSAIPVMIAGETGTGKELVARGLHQASARSGPFVPVNCAALPATLVESTLFGHRKGAFTGATTDQDGAFLAAHGGTLFLDEVRELALEAQPKLLRVLEDGDVTPVGASRPSRVDVRIVVATNLALEEAVQGGRFRQDLFARLAGIQIATPRLRDRREDIPLLFAHLIDEAHRRRPLTADFAEGLLLHPWPQNVRELKRMCERFSVLHPEAPRWQGDMLDDSLRKRVTERQEGGAGVQAPRSGPPSREDLLGLLARFDGNVSLLAKFVGRNRKQVYRWMDELGIERGAGRE